MSVKRQCQLVLQNWTRATLDFTALSPDEKELLKSSDSLIFQLIMFYRGFGDVLALSSNGAITSIEVVCHQPHADDSLGAVSTHLRLGTGVTIITLSTMERPLPSDLPSANGSAKRSRKRKKSKRRKKKESETVSDSIGETESDEESAASSSEFIAAIESDSTTVALDESESDSKSESKSKMKRVDESKLEGSGTVAESSGAVDSSLLISSATVGRVSFKKVMDSVSFEAATVKRADASDALDGVRPLSGVPAAHSILRHRMRDAWHASLCMAPMQTHLFRVGGGHSTRGLFGDASKSAEVLDLFKMQWTNLPRMKHARARPGCCVLPHDIPRHYSLAARSKGCAALGGLTDDDVSDVESSEPMTVARIRDKAARRKTLDAAKLMKAELTPSGEQQPADDCLAVGSVDFASDSELSHTRDPTPRTPMLSAADSRLPHSERRRKIVLPFGPIKATLEAQGTASVEDMEALAMERCVTVEDSAVLSSADLKEPQNVDDLMSTSFVDLLRIRRRKERAAAKKGKHSRSKSTSALKRTPLSQESSGFGLSSVWGSGDEVLSEAWDRYPPFDVFVCGGIDGNTLHRKCEVFHADSCEWQTVAPLKQARCGHVTLYLGHATWRLRLRQSWAKGFGAKPSALMRATADCSFEDWAMAERSAADRQRPAEGSLTRKVAERMEARSRRKRRAERRKRKGAPKNTALSSKVFVCGGRAKSGVPLTSCEMYDVSTNQFTMCKRAPFSNDGYQSGCFLAASQRVAICGGAKVGNRIAVYEPVADKWHALYNSATRGGCAVHAPMHLNHFAPTVGSVWLHEREYLYVVADDYHFKAFQVYDDRCNCLVPVAVELKAHKHESDLTDHLNLLTEDKQFDCFLSL